uniref:Uncharacterized protein n=1 Tax=Kalanchoe fedtschenkoi TaxID=63787 RepID=A0A7N0TVE1_KALFE
MLKVWCPPCTTKVFVTILFIIKHISQILLFCKVELPKAYVKCPIPQLIILSSAQALS